MNVQSIPIGEIEVHDRLREVDADYVALLAASISVDGLRSPVEVRKQRSGRGYQLVFGAHRLAAHRQLDLPEIAAVVVSLNDLEARRREIEENLIRHDLTELDRSVFLAEWKQVYEAMHPETKHGGARKAASRQIGDLKDALFATSEEGRAARFSVAASEKFGTSPRTVDRAIKRFKNLAPDVRKALSGTWLSRKGVELDGLARLAPGDQRRVVALLLSGDADAPANVKAAAARVTGKRPVVPNETAAQYEKLVKAWRMAVPVAQDRFLDWLAQQPGVDLTRFGGEG